MKADVYFAWHSLRWAYTPSGPPPSTKKQLVLRVLCREGIPLDEEILREMVGERGDLEGVGGSVAKCDILIDTSIAWAAAEHRAQKAIRRFFSGLRETYTVCYTEHTLVELAVTGYTSFRIRSILNSMARPVTTGIEPDAAYRYRIVRRIGVNDVLIVLAARQLGAILATGDWTQARFYMNLTGRRPIYLPLRTLEDIVRVNR